MQGFLDPSNGTCLPCNLFLVYFLTEKELQNEKNKLRESLSLNESLRKEVKKLNEQISVLQQTYV